MQAAIVADGGGKAGLGHVTRCLGLAQGLAAVTRRKPVFVVRDTACRRMIEGYGFKCQARLGGPWDLVVGDSYRFSLRELKQIRSVARSVLLLDDVGRIPPVADWVLNSAPGAQASGYSRLGPRRRLLGPAFHPFRKEFWKPAKRKSPRLRRVLVTLGGGNIALRLADRIVVLLARRMPSLKIDLIVGPFAEVDQKRYAASIRIHRAPRRMRSLMEQSDLAVSGGGQTLFELARLGVPVVAVEVADNQRSILRGFEKSGAVLNAGSPDSGRFSVRFGSLIQRMLTDQSLCDRMSQAASRMVDGKGALRVAQRLASEVR